MVARVLDIYLEEQLIAERQERGIDKFDEVWDGVYVMSPLANDEHQRIAGFLNTLFTLLIQFRGLGEVRQGINLTDHPNDWTKNFRVPDIAVFLTSGMGICHGAYWMGGPDLAVEVVSPGEEPEDKFEFYGRIGTRELLIVHRDPWRLDLYGPEPAGMHLVQSASVNQPAIASAAVDLMFQLRGSEDDPELVVTHPDGRTWAL